MLKKENQISIGNNFGFLVASKRATKTIHWSSGARCILALTQLAKKPFLMHFKSYIRRMGRYILENQSCGNLKRFNPKFSWCWLFLLYHKKDPRFRGSEFTAL